MVESCNRVVSFIVTGLTVDYEIKCTIFNTRLYLKIKNDLNNLLINSQINHNYIKFLNANN